MQLKMKNILLCTLMFLSGSAFADTTNYAGPSVGVHLTGYDYKNQGNGASFDDLSDPALIVWSETNKEQSIKGIRGGLKAGYNWQKDNIVYGITGDITYLGDDKKTESPGGIFEGNYSFHRYDRLNFLSTVKGKFGYVVNDFFPYIMGGVAVGSFKNTHQTITCCGTLWESNRNENEVGYVVGFGVEKNISDRFSLNLEGSYIDFGKNQGDANGRVGILRGNSSRVSLENEIYLINAGLNYKF